MSWVATAIIGSAVVGGAVSNRASKRAASAVSGASNAATAEQRRQFDIATGLMQPSITAGNTARDQLMQLLGLGGGTAGVGSSALGTQVGQGGFPTGGFRSLSLDPRGGEFGGRALLGPRQPTNATGTAPQNPIDIIKNTPGYQFQIEQKTRALNANRSAGGTSGGELFKDFANYVHGSTAGQFYQDYANRLAGLAGSAQTGSSNLAALGVQSGANIGNSLMNAGNARASGIIGQGNAWGNALNDIGGYIGMNGWPFGGNNNPGGGGKPLIK